MENPTDPETVNSQTGLPPHAEHPDPHARSFREATAAGFRSARADAERAARTAAPKVKEAFTQAAYDLSYVSAFATFFGITLIKEIVPEAVKAGFSEGAKRGQQAADTVAGSDSPMADAAPAAAS